MTTTAEITKHEPLDVERATPENGHTEATSLIRLAIEKNVDVEKLEKLFDLHERALSRKAKEEFFSDLARFQAECPAIKKTGESNQFKRANRDGGGTRPYPFLELDFICDTIRPHLHKYGFSYTWDEPEAPTKEGLVGTWCHVRHRNGHTESARFYCPVESKAGCSAQQQYAAAATYSKRYALIAALGLSGTERDTDGVNPEVISGQRAYAEPQRGNGHAATTSGDPGPVSLDGYVTQEEVATLARLIKETDTQPERFFKAYGIHQLSDLPARDFPQAKVFLDRKAAEKKKGAAK